MEQIHPPSEPTTLAASVATLSYQGAMVELLELLRDPPGPSAFYKQTLTAIGTSYAIPLGALEIQVGGHVIHHTYRDDEQTPESWEAIVSDLLTEALSDPQPIVRIFESEEVQLDACMVAVPLVDERGEGIGALAMVAPCDDPKDAQEVLRGVHALVLLASLCPLRPTQGPVEEDVRRIPTGHTLRKLSRFTDLVELAFAITNNLRNKVGCDVVALGAVQRRRVRLLSISGMHEVKQNGPAAEAIRAAMEECHDRGAPVVHDPGAEEDGGYRLHAQWSERFGGQPVASIPLASEGRCRAVLSLRRPRGRGFEPAELEEVATLVQPYVEGMDILDRAARTLPRHLWESAVEAVGELIRPQFWVRKVAAVAAMVALVWFLFGTTTFEVSAPCVVAPTRVQHVGAPYDGRIRAAPLVAGDRFRRGDVLCVLDTTALELERSRIEAEIEVASIQEREALAGGDAFGVELLRRKAAGLAAQLALVEHQIEAGVIRAPFDGFVLEGDLRDRIGDGCAQGEGLFQLTQDQTWELELLVDEADVLHVRKGMRGSFASYARPEERRPFEVTRIHPAVETRHGRPGVLVEGSTDGTPQWLRPGMEGVARVEAGQRRVWWVTLRRAIDFLRLRFWL